jgi:hypothetical protein
MIANGIDGSSGGAQILDLLALVAADPKVYQAKLKELQDTADRNQKYVEAVGPASDILILRDQAKTDAADAVQALQDAKDQATQLVSDAQTQAKSIVDAANAEATDTTNEAKLLKATAASAMSVAQTAQANADAAQAKADAAMLANQARAKDLEKAIADAQEASAAADAAKAEIIAKHQAFIESL